jgi:tetratricopeptide (TPR) repeat protein
LIADINDPKNVWYRLAEVRLAQAYLWAGDSEKALPMFEHILKDYVIPEIDLTIRRDAWMGYIDAVSGMIGERFRVVKTDEDIARIRRNLFTEEQKAHILWCYQRADKILPDPRTRLSDPELYTEELEYYTGSLGRLGIELAYMGEMEKSREIYARAVNLNTERKIVLRLLREYAQALQNIRLNREAEAIYQQLLAEQTRPEGR